MKGTRTPEGIVQRVGIRCKPIYADERYILPEKPKPKSRITRGSVSVRRNVRRYPDRV